jgi:catechol 2,3-dioxygenase-like lactoylglutathione lyase family enzyme
MAFLVLGPVRLELLHYARLGATTAPAENDAGAAHVCLQVDDVRELYGRLRAQGVEFVSEPLRQELVGATWVFLKDPDGINVELLELS